jgi:hypothetical protein
MELTPSVARGERWRNDRFNQSETTMESAFLL